MWRIIVVASAVVLSAMGACGNDPRIVDAGMPGSDAPVSSQMCKMGSSYLQDCNNPSQCMGCACVPFGHALYCTPTCTSMADCPPPATACSMGYCMR